MSMFERLERAASRAVDRTFSIRFEVHPATSTANGRPAPDPKRAVWHGKGILDEMPVYDSVETGKRDRAGNDLHTLRTGTLVELSVDRNRYPPAIAARQGDRVQFDDLRRFEILSVRRDGMSRVVFQLNELR